MTSSKSWNSSEEGIENEEPSWITKKLQADLDDQSTTDGDIQANLNLVKNLINKHKSVENYEMEIYNYNSTEYLSEKEKFDDEIFTSNYLNPDIVSTSSLKELDQEQVNLTLKLITEKTALNENLKQTNFNFFKYLKKILIYFKQELKKKKEVRELVDILEELGDVMQFRVHFGNEYDLFLKEFFNSNSNNFRDESKSLNNERESDMRDLKEKLLVLRDSNSRQREELEDCNKEKLETLVHIKNLEDTLIQTKKKIEDLKNNLEFYQNENNNLKISKKNLSEKFELCSISEKTFRENFLEQKTIVKDFSLKTFHLENLLQQHKDALEEARIYHENYKECQKMVNISNNLNISHLKHVVQKSFGNEDYNSEVEVVEEIIGSEKSDDIVEIQALKAELKMVRDRYDVDTMVLQKKLTLVESESENFRLIMEEKLKNFKTEEEWNTLLSDLKTLEKEMEKKESDILIKEKLIKEFKESYFKMSAELNEKKEDCFKLNLSLEKSREE
ncbi:hypothetical protein HK099_004626, partial [Clydaea vesicula]